MVRATHSASPSASPAATAPLGTAPHALTTHTGPSLLHVGNQSIESQVQIIEVFIYTHSGAAQQRSVPAAPSASETLLLLYDIIDSAWRAERRVISYRVMSGVILVSSE